jgi:hypothetical protein
MADELSHPGPAHAEEGGDLGDAHETGLIIACHDHKTSTEGKEIAEGPPTIMDLLGWCRRALQ